MLILTHFMQLLHNPSRKFLILSISISNQSNSLSPYVRALARWPSGHLLDGYNIMGRGINAQHLMINVLEGEVGNSKLTKKGPVTSKSWLMPCYQDVYSKSFEIIDRTMYTYLHLALIVIQCPVYCLFRDH